MMDPKDRYLEALDQCLRPHLPEALRMQRIREIGSHLAMDQADRQEHGLDVDAAAQAARKALGSPQVLAREMVRQARGYDSAPAWRLALVSGFGLALAIFLTFTQLRPTQYPPNTTSIALHCLPFLVLIYFSYRVVRTQRWLVWPMAGWVVIALIGVITLKTSQVVASSPAPSVSSRANLIAHARSLQKAQGIVDEWRAGNAPTDQAPDFQAGLVLAAYFPYFPYPFAQRFDSYTLKHVAAPEAARLWRLNGEGYSDSIQRQLEGSELALGMADHPDQVWVLLLKNSIRPAMLGLIKQLAFIAALNGILLYFTWLSLRRKTRRDPLIA